MNQEQLELNFDASSGTEQGAQVVAFDAFLQARVAREQRKIVQSHALLVEEIVKSVEHITGRSADAEAM